MIIEIRRPEGKTPYLILIPNYEEAKTIESVLGDKVINDDGLITLVAGRYKIADGYGTAYISVGPIKADSTELSTE